MSASYLVCSHTASKSKRTCVALCCARGATLWQVSCSPLCVVASKPRSCEVALLPRRVQNARNSGRHSRLADRLMCRRISGGPDPGHNRDCGPGPGRSRDRGPGRSRDRSLATAYNRDWVASYDPSKDWLRSRRSRLRYLSTDTGPDIRPA